MTFAESVKAAAARRDGRLVPAEERHILADFRKIVALVGKGVSVTDACRVVGRSREFYYSRRREWLAERAAS